MRRAIAIALLIALARPALAVDTPPLQTKVISPEGLKLTMDGPPPGTYAKLLWSYDGKDAVGYWFSAELVLSIKKREDGLKVQNDYLATKAAQQCFDATVTETKKTLEGTSGVLIWTGAGIVIGAVLGILVYRKLQ